MPPTGGRRQLLVLALAGALLATGCGTAATSAPSDNRPAVVVEQVLAGRVPEAVKTDGRLVVGIDPAFAPAEYRDPDTDQLTGFDVELFDMVAAKLGLTTEYVSTGFDAIIPGVLAGTYEIGVSAITVNPARKQQALLVSYFQAGTQWATRAGNPTAFDPAAPCGARVAVQATTVQEADVTNRSRQCTTGKKPEVVIRPYEESAQAAAAVADGASDAVVGDSVVLGHAVSRAQGRLQLVGEVYGATPYGYVVAKGQQPLAEAVRDAVQSLIADGSYGTLLDRWGVRGGAVTQAAINP